MHTNKLGPLKDRLQRAYWELLQIVEELESRTRETETTSPPRTGRSKRLRWGKLTKTVAAVLPQMSDIFTPFAVRKQIEKIDPDLAAAINDSSLSAALSRLAGRGVVQIQRQGMGRRQTTYRYIAPRFSAAPFGGQTEQHGFRVARNAEVVLRQEEVKSTTRDA